MILFGIVAQTPCFELKMILSLTSTVTLSVISNFGPLVKPTEPIAIPGSSFHRCDRLLTVDSIWGGTIPPNRKKFVKKTANAIKMIFY